MTEIDRIAEILETLDRLGDADVKLSPDARRLLGDARRLSVQAAIIARRRETETDARQSQNP